MKTKLNRYGNNISGLAGVEFALIAPILIFILIAVADFGMYMNMSLKMENVARSAAQYVLQGGDIEQVEEDVIMAGNLNVSADEIDTAVAYVCECGDGEAVECDETCDAADDYLRRFIDVNLTVQHQAMINWPGIADHLTLQGHVRLQANE